MKRKNGASDTAKPRAVTASRVYLVNKSLTESNNLVGRSINVGGGGSTHAQPQQPASEKNVEKKRKRA